MGIRSPKTEVEDGHGLPHVCLEQSLGPLRKQQGLLTAEPSFRPLEKVLKTQMNIP